MIVVAKDEVEVEEVEAEDPHPDPEADQENEFVVILIAVVPVRDLCPNQEITALHPEIEEVLRSRAHDPDPHTRTEKMTAVTEVTATTEQQLVV
jgi:hypothetical protein